MFFRFYIVPVVVVSIMLNIPKFLEVQLEVNDEGVPSYKLTNLRLNQTYIRVYIMWTRLFSTAVIPVSLLIFLNLRIICDLLCRTSKVQRFGSVKRQRKEMNLCLILLCIVLVFFLCHAARITLDVYEFSNVELVISCWPPYVPATWAQGLSYISHLMMILNSSVNFIVYCLVGHTFRRELCRTLGFQKSYYGRAPVSEISRRPSGSLGGGGQSQSKFDNSILTNGHHYARSSTSSNEENNKFGIIMTSNCSLKIKEDGIEEEKKVMLNRRI